MLISLRLAFIFVGLGSSCLAVNSVYLANVAVGGDTGVDCANAKAYSYFNSAGNWSATPSGIEIGPDTTVHLCGVVTGTSGQTGLTFQGDGTSGHPVILLFETGASMQAPYWGTGGSNLTGAIVASGRSDITVDGGSNGFIQNTTNGTPGQSCPGGTCTNPAHDSNGIVVSNCSRCTIQNLTIADIYDMQSLTDGNGYGRGISKEGSATDLTITNVTIHDSGYCIFFDVASGSASTNFTVSNSDLSRCSTVLAVAGGNGSTGTLAGLVMSGNSLHDLVNWNDTAYNFHHNGLHIWSYASTSITGMQIYNNEFYGDFGQGTGWVYFENYSGTTEMIQIFNNLFHETETTCGFGCGPFSLWLQTGASGDIIQAQIYNNTFKGGNDSMGGIYIEGSTGHQYDLRNNTSQGYANLLQIDSGVSRPLTTSNNNDWYFGTSGVINDEGTGGYNATTFGAWRTLCGCDASSITSNPNLDGTYKPVVGSTLIDLGQNLTSLGIIALNSDKAGIPRPASGAWDAGAYQYSAGGGSRRDGKTRSEGKTTGQ